MYNIYNGKGNNLNRSRSGYRVEFSYQRRKAAKNFSGTVQNGKEKILIRSTR